MMNGGMYGFGFGFGILWMLLFWGILILLAVWLIRFMFPSTSDKKRSENSSAPAASPSALDILRTRYANGELTTEEYQERVSILQQEQIS